jgi:hypothetical protein
MKSLYLLLITVTLTFAIDEIKQLKQTHPLQRDVDTQQLLCDMQESITTYLYETPLSSYQFFHQKRGALQSQAMVTWIHGDTDLQKLSAAKTPKVRAILRDAKNAHLGDYRYDLFTLMSDLLLQMREESDFSGSKEKAILSKVVEGYFKKINDPQRKCPCINEALHEVKPSDILIEYTHIKAGNRHLHKEAMKLSTPSKQAMAEIKKSTKKYFASLGLLGIKDIALDHYGNYLLLSEGKSKAVQDDLIFTLSPKTLPLSYRFDKQMKKTYLKASKATRSHQGTFSTQITLQKKTFFLAQRHPDLELKPESDQTRAYKKYASALGHMLAVFHTNPKLQPCKQFSHKASRQVNERLVEVELVTLAYEYHDTLEQRWEAFSSKDLLTCN